MDIRIIEQPQVVLNYYKKIGLLIPIGISCSWKCEGCINKQHKDEYVITVISIDKIIDRYLRNPLVESLILAGLEPFDNPHDLMHLIDVFRTVSQDDIVIYTGYEIGEFSTILSIRKALKKVMSYNNIIIKFGKYIPGRKETYDEILGITLKSDNQWACKIEI